MILDNLNNYETYLSTHPGFKKGFEFLRNPKLSELEEGKHIIKGDHMFALVMNVEGKTKKNASFETHQKYIDIQYTVSGNEIIGWQDQALCIPNKNGYNPDKDIQFYSNQPKCWVPVPSGCFAIFFPHDAHAPLGINETIHKVVIKVAKKWNDQTFGHYSRD